jgi:hypothetical protein
VSPLRCPTAEASLFVEDEILDRVGQSQCVLLDCDDFVESCRAVTGGQDEEAVGGLIEDSRKAGQ